MLGPVHQKQKAKNKKVSLKAGDLKKLSKTTKIIPLPKSKGDKLNTKKVKRKRKKIRNDEKKNH